MGGMTLTVSGKTKEEVERRLDEISKAYNEDIGLVEELRDIKIEDGKYKGLLRLCK